VMAPSNFRVDAWVNPPTYTGKPPVILPGLRPGEPVQTASNLSVPAGSTLVIRATGNIQLDVVVSGGVTDLKAATQSGGAQSGAAQSNVPRSNAAQGTEELRYTINDAGSATVRGVGANDVTWQFTAIPDRPPTIALTKDPEAQARGTLQLSYKLEDDYGVVDAHATFKLKQGDGGNGQPAPRALFESPDFTLSRWLCRRLAPATASARPPRT
jgi:hypothetical protein